MILRSPTTQILDLRTVLPRPQDVDAVRALERQLLIDFGARPGHYSTWKSLEPFLIDVHKGLIDALCQELAFLDTLELCKRAYEALENLYGAQKQDRLAAAPDVLLRGRAAASVRTFDVGRMLGPSTLGIRYLIEMSLKYGRNPGRGPKTRERLFLIALATRIVELDSLMEHVFHETIPHELVIDDEHVQTFQASKEAESALVRWKRDAQPHMFSRLHAELTGLSQSVFNPVKVDDVTSSDLWQYLDRPMKKELGYSLTDWTEFVVCLLGSFGEKNRTVTIRRVRLEAKLQRHGLDEYSIASLLRDKTLNRQLLEPLNQRDMLPAENFWRDLRVLNRPLIEIERGRTSLLVFGIETLASGSPAHIRRLGEGKFPSAKPGGPIQKAIGTMTSQGGAFFRDELARECQKRGHDVKTEKGNAGNTAVPGNMGPVDVFVVDRNGKRFILAEVKDISGESLVARDLKEQRERFLGPSRSSSKGFVEKVRAQKEWFSSQLSALKSEFKIPESEFFTVEGIIVVNSPLLWVYLSPTRLPILDDKEFLTRLTLNRDLLSNEI